MIACARGDSDVAMRDYRDATSMPMLAVRTAVLLGMKKVQGRVVVFKKDEGGLQITSHPYSARCEKHGEQC